MNNVINPTILSAVQKKVATDPLKNAAELLTGGTVRKSGSAYLFNGAAVPEMLRIFPFSGITMRFIYVAVPLNMRTARKRHATAPFVSATVPLMGAIAGNNGVMEKNNGSIAAGGKNTVPFFPRKEQNNRAEHFLLRSEH